MTTLYSTDFETGTVGSTFPGWTAVIGAWAVDTQGVVSGTKAFRNTDNVSAASILYTGGASTTDGFVSLKYVVNGDTIPCPIWRSDSGYNNCYLFAITPSTGNVTLFKRAGGSFTGISAQTVSFAGFANGSAVNVEVKFVSSTFELRVWANGSARPSAASASFTDTTYTSAGYTGVFLAGGTSSAPNSFDDYSVSDNASAPSGTTIARDAAGIAYSPLVWDDDGTSKIANSNNAAVKFNFTGTSLSANIPTVATGLAAYPTYRIYIDTLPAVDITPSGGQTSLTLASGLSAGTHTCRLVLKGTPLNDRWNTVAGLSITGFQVDNGATVSAPTGINAVPSKVAAVWGDSISEGERVFSTAAPPAGSDGTLAIWPQIADALGAELAPIAYGGQGYEQAGVGGVPSYLSSYATFNSAGRSRLTSGLYATQPDYIFDWHGTNGTTTQSDVATMITNHRAAAPNAWIFMVVAVSGAARAAKTAAVNAAIAAGDTKVVLIDMPTIYASYFGQSLTAANARSYDGVHPTAAENARIAVAVMKQVQHAIEPRRFTVIAS